METQCSGEQCGRRLRFSFERSSKCLVFLARKILCFARLNKDVEQISFFLLGNCISLNLHQNSRSGELEKDKYTLEFNLSDIWAMIWPSVIDELMLLARKLNHYIVLSLMRSVQTDFILIYTFNVKRLIDQRPTR